MCDRKFSNLHCSNCNFFCPFGLDPSYPVSCLGACMTLANSQQFERGVISGKEIGKKSTTEINIAWPQNFWGVVHFYDILQDGDHLCPRIRLRKEEDMGGTLGMHVYELLDKGVNLAGQGIDTFKEKGMTLLKSQNAWLMWLLLLPHFDIRSKTIAPREFDCLVCGSMSSLRMLLSSISALHTNNGCLLSKSNKLGREEAGPFWTCARITSKLGAWENILLDTLYSWLYNRLTPMGSQKNGIVCVGCYSATLQYCHLTTIQPSRLHLVLLWLKLSVWRPNESFSCLPVVRFSSCTLFCRTLPASAPVWHKLTWWHIWSWESCNILSR